ncbi:X-ray repair cross-complementing protein 5-like [Haliotis cracherodii]|uniref:X-ray repair cross-complementing protein 5-like n=1 Tax=Haliotis cracherodii TaxID=6455 RepID=UPI0039ED5BBB
MAANKEAIAIVLDVGPSMNQAPPGEVSALQTAIDAVTMILQRKMFSESKDEVALVLFGTDGTDNPLADGDSYQNITIARPIGVADFDLLQQVKDEIQPSDTAADFLDALVVAMDHLVQGIQGKRGFASKRVILLSDLGGEFGDDQLDTIIGALHNSGTNLDVIGPNIDDDEDEEGGGDAGGASVNGHRKEKTPQQRAGEAMVKHILDQVEGECYSFSEALPALSYFTARQVRPTAWKCTMDIGPDLRIPINFYGKIKDFKLKQSWKKVYAKDPDQKVGNLRTQHMNDEEETEMEREDIVQGYRYGNTLVPMSEDDKENMKYRAEKCLKVLGFTKSENVRRHHFLGDGTNVVFAEKGDEAAGVALSAIINALYETNMVVIARRVYSSASGPKLGVLWPSIKANYECLYWVEIPFAEDLRQFTFGTLPITDDGETNKKYKPTAEQLNAVDDLITSMDLSQAAADDDDDEEEKTEVLKPKLTFNPYFQRLYQCLQHRAENTDEGLPELSPIIASYLKPPQEIITNCEEHVEKIKKLFKLEMVTKKKEEQTGETMFKDNEAEAGPAPKRQKLDDNLEGGMQDITRAKVTQVGTVTPTADFQALISRKDEDMFEEACKQMQKRVEQIVTDSFGTQFYGKAMECLKALRQECIKKQEAKVYNDFMTKYKDKLIGKGKRDFWDQIVQDKQALITKMECEDGGVSKEEANKFVEEEVKDEPAPAADAETTDDLMDQLE